MMSSIDFNLYDRQIRTYGIDAVIKMNASSVLIYGLGKGLGTEVGKNLALGGVKNIFLFDSSPIEISDIETGYYYNTHDIDTPKSQVLAPKLQELNPHIKVSAVDNHQQNQMVTILINMPVDVIKMVEQYCYSINSKMVALWSYSFFGTIFVNAGNHHITSENIEMVQIGSISEDGIIMCAPHSSHNFQSGDTVCFTNMQGANLECFMNKTYVIDNINKTSFQLIKFNNNKFNFINGTAEYVKKDITISHNMFDDNELKLEQEQYKDFEFIPVVSIMGSFAASEVIKLITNKYTPANQWYKWSDTSILPIKKETDYDYANNAYSRMWGEEYAQKLANTRWLLVGAGAIGCEHLKNLAFMGVKNIVVTDPDSIEVSNLNQQFLFRHQDIGKPKSITAVKTICSMKKDLNYTAVLEKVSPNNSFTDIFLGDINMTGVLNALDNITARKFMDEQCFKFNKPLFECGTTGTKGNVQVVIPFQTETYSASTDPEQEKSFPMCMIKSFPNEIYHTIQWAIDNFEFFNRAPTNMNKYLENSEYLEQLSQVEKNQAILDINILSKLNTPENCMKWCVDMFYENFHDNIMVLLDTFKPDHEVSPGVKFWSGGKRCPKPISLDVNNTLHMDYITTMYSMITNITNNNNNNNIIQFIKTYKYIKSEDKLPEKLQEKVCWKSGLLKPQEFDKDNTLHVNIIKFASNMRALNYDIIPISYHETKGIAGRIIPAISTTTSIVSGLTMIELLKYVLNKDITTYRNTFINLADPLLVYSEPMPAHMIDIAGVKINEWTKFDYNKDTSVGEFKQYYEDMFKTTISMIVVGTSILYAEFLGDDVLNDNMKNVIKRVLDTETLPTNITISIACDDDMIELPNVNFISL